MKRKVEQVGNVLIDVTHGPVDPEVRAFLETPEAELERPSTQSLETLGLEMTPEEILAEVEREEVLASVGSLIALARKQRQLSQRDLSRLIGVKAPRVAQVEHGQNLEIATLVDYAQVLGYDLEVSFIPREGGEPIRAKPRS